MAAPQHESDALLAAALAGDLAPAERTDFLDRLESDGDARREFFRLLETGKQLDAYQRTGGYQHARAPVAVPGRANELARYRSRRTPLAAAAVLLVALGMGLGYAYLFGGPSGSTRAVTHSAGFGECLIDGRASRPSAQPFRRLAVRGSQAQLRLQAGSLSVCDFRVAGETQLIVRLHARTRVQLLQLPGRLLFRLVSGELLLASERLRRAEGVEVAVSGALVRMVGTRIVVRSWPSGWGHVRVVQGRVQVTALPQGKLSGIYAGANGDRRALLSQELPRLFGGRAPVVDAGGMLRLVPPATQGRNRETESLERVLGTTDDPTRLRRAARAWRVGQGGRPSQVRTRLVPAPVQAVRHAERKREFEELLAGRPGVSKGPARIARQRAGGVRFRLHLRDGRRLVGVARQTAHGYEIVTDDGRLLRLSARQVRRVDVLPVR